MGAIYQPTTATNKTTGELDEWDTGTCVVIVRCVSTVTYAQWSPEFPADDILKALVLDCEPEKWFCERVKQYTIEKHPFPKPRQRIISDRNILLDRLTVNLFARPPPKGS